MTTESRKLLSKEGRGWEMKCLSDEKKEKEIVRRKVMPHPP